MPVLSGIMVNVYVVSGILFLILYLTYPENLPEKGISAIKLPFESNNFVVRSLYILLPSLSFTWADIYTFLGI